MHPTQTLNEQLSLEDNLKWLTPPCTLTAEDFDQDGAGCDPEWYDN